MFSLSVIVGPTVWGFLFKTEEAAMKSVEAIAVGKDGDRVEVFDDFGQRAAMEFRSIGGWMLEDLNESKLAHVARALHQAHINAECHKAAYSDPALQQVARGPAILSPMGNGRF
jgi:hypothetical protein